MTLELVVFVLLLWLFGNTYDFPFHFSPAVRGENLRFKEGDVLNLLKEVFIPWLNAYRFFVQQVERYFFPNFVYYTFFLHEICGYFYSIYIYYICSLSIS